jgi:hypothetical protein
MAMNKASSAGQIQSWELSAREVLLPLLRPGETLHIALSGATGWFQGLSLPDLLLALGGILGGVFTSALHRTTTIGITDEHLVFAISIDPEKPSRLQRAPLGRVSIVKFKESRTLLLIDVLVIDTGTQRLTLSTSPSLRPVVQELSAALAARRQEAGITGSAGPLQAPLLPLHVRLSRLPGRLAFRLKTAVLDGDIAAALRESGPASASLRASRISLIFCGASIAAGLLLFIGLMALTYIFPAGLSGPLQDILLFILLLPLFLATLLGSIAALAAAGLAIYSLFKRGERPLTVTAALLAAAALVFIYYVFATALLTAG